MWKSHLAATPNISRSVGSFGVWLVLSRAEGRLAGALWIFAESIPELESRIPVALSRI